MTDAAKTLDTQAHEPDKEMDRLWANEAAERWAAYQRGEIKALPLEEVLAKYRTE